VGWGGGGEGAGSLGRPDVDPVPMPPVLVAGLT
jgi:hypothetical protein